jgi:hypothetical protein
VRSCVGAVYSSGRRGLLARQQAHCGVELPTTQRRSIEHEPVLVAPPGKLAVDWEGIPFLAGVPPSAP